MIRLFVFFEVLLIASYALLLHGLGAQRVGAAMHVVVLNLIGSALFLLAVGTLYGVTGTLNLADLARVMPLLGPDTAPLARSGALLLLGVFALKAALLPLGFWLPRAYAAATGATAALFAVLTKVGVYAILRFAAALTPDRGGRCLVTVLLGTSGAMALFCGHVEYYAPLAAVVLLYLWIACRAVLYEQRGERCEDVFDDMV